MPKWEFSLNSESANKDLGKGFYTGPVPPIGNYWCLLKKITIGPNSNKDPMFKILLEIKEPEDGRPEFNGYGIWENLNVIDASAPWLNNFVDALDGQEQSPLRKLFVPGGGGVAYDSSGNVTKMGHVKPLNKMLLVSTKAGGDQFGNPRLDVARYLIGSEAPEIPEEDEEPSVALGEEDEGEFYTEEELKELNSAELREILDGWSISYAPKATSRTLIKIIINAQEESQAEEEGAEEAEDEEGAAAEVETYTKEELGEMDREDLLAIFESNGWETPRPAIPRKLIAEILRKQAEPPF